MLRPHGEPGGRQPQLKGAAASSMGPQLCLGICPCSSLDNAVMKPTVYTSTTSLNLWYKAGWIYGVYTCQHFFSLLKSNFGRVLANCSLSFLFLADMSCTAALVHLLLPWSLASTFKITYVSFLPQSDAFQVIFTMSRCLNALNLNKMTFCFIISL